MQEHADLEKKRMRMMLIGVVILFGGIFLYKLFMGLVLKYVMSHQSSIVSVASTTVKYADWQPKVIASGSLRAIRGVNVTTELAAMVQTIYFTPGAMVNKGEVLVQLNANSDIAALRALEANAALALITYNRDKQQYAVNGVSKQQLDTDAANLKNLNAQVAQQAAIVAKKTIVAPFSGRLGISAVNPGQYINPGDKIVNLQTMNPIYIDFYLPQQALSRLKVNYPVIVTCDAYPGKEFKGKVTTIDPGVDPSTRNVAVEATILNPHYELMPGMFAYVELKTGHRQRYLTLPQSAITYNPYGDIVYKITQQSRDYHGKPILIATQSFVRTGETRGDQVIILKGLVAGDTVVASGQLKLKNGSQVAINNSIRLPDNPLPNLNNDHTG